MKYWIASLLAVASNLVFAGEIMLEISGCTTGKDVRVALYSVNEDFSKDSDGKDALRTQVVKAEGHIVRFSFHDLLPGKYVIAAFVGTNGNHKLDSNILGMPIEPYGFSRDARHFFSRPNFEQAAIEVGNSSVIQTIHLK